VSNNGKYLGLKPSTQLSRLDSDIFWFNWNPETRILFVHYGLCVLGANRAGLNVYTFFDQILDTLRKNTVQKLIIDLRGNPGGSGYPGGHFMAGLSTLDIAGLTGKIFVLQDSGTYSSATSLAYELKERTKAVFIGSPLPEASQDWGEVLYLQLPRTKITIGYSSRFIKSLETYYPTLMPDIPVEMSFEDRIADQDPWLEAALAYPAAQ
jgi:hypothetical protein